jgi:O-antigen/teichoic acid export membrane protein
MTQKFAAGDRDGALGAFQSVWALMSAVLAVILLAASVAWLFRYQISARFPALGISTELMDAGILLIVYSITAVQMSIISGGYQSTQRYAQGTFLQDLIAPVESAALVAVVLAHGGIAVAALTITVVRVIGAVAFYLRLRSYEPWIRLGVSHASMADLRRLAHPALASLSMTLSTALNIQGVILGLGFFVSPAAAAVFGAARLLSRVPLQIADLAGRASLPEMSAAHARRDRVTTAMLAVVNLGVTAAVVAPATIVMVLAGPFALSLLSHHRLHADLGLFFWLAMTAAVQAGWNTVGQFLFAINRQQAFAYAYMVLAAAPALAPVVVGRTDALDRVSAVWFASEAATFVIVYRAWWRESDLHVDDIARAAREILRQALAMASGLRASWRVHRGA